QPGRRGPRHPDDLPGDHGRTLVLRPLLRLTDEDVEKILGVLLRTGVVLAAAIVLVGGVVYLASNWREPPEYRKYREEPGRLRSVGGIVRDAMAGESKGIIQLGLLVLVATPVARVFFSILAFAVQRDLTYVLITSFVFSVLIYSLFWGGT